MPTMFERHRQPEIMDEPCLEIVQHHKALRGLSRLNWLSCSDAILWDPICRLAQAKRGRTLRVLDVATGGGDVLLRLYHRARRSGLSIEFAGLDFSHTAVDFARRKCQAQDAKVAFFLLDALNQPLPSDYDVITCSLFLHHLETDQAEEILRNMARAARSMVLVNDLIRSRLGYVLAYMGTRLFSTSSIVHHDGLRSVQAAFTMQEAMYLAQRAGLIEASLSWHWPFRFRLQWLRQ